MQSESPVRIFTDPQVYIVGRQTVDDAELDRFLDDHGVTWESDSEVAAEVLTETAGRTCFMSFSRPRPGGNSAYLSHIKEAGHGSVLEHAVWNLIITNVSRSLCYAPDTEVLTRSGWKPVTDLVVGEQLLTKCPKTGGCRWSVNRELLCTWHSGEIHWFENSEWSSPAITPDHLVWCARYDLRQARDLSCREIMDRFAHKVPYDDVRGKRIVVDHAIKKDGLDPSEIVIGGRSYSAEKFFEWLGWLCTDGGCGKRRKMCYVTQTKAENWKRIADLMDGLFPDRWTHGTSGSTSNHVARVFDSAIWDFVVNNFGRLKSDRRLTWLFDYSERLVGKFLEGAIGGDGTTHQDNGHQVLYCPYVAQAGDYQVLFAITGRSACVRVGAAAGRSHIANGVAFKSTMDEILVSVHKGSTTLIRANQQMSRPYSGFVYCPKTDDGLVYVRRKGHGFWCGNTHELIRHRTNSFSQLSQRYVDESVAEYVEPGIIANDPDLHDIWLDSVKHSHAAYVKLAAKLAVKLEPELARRYRLDPQRNIDDPDLRQSDLGLIAASRTEIRKAARQAARSVLPNATETKIFVTANGRSLRHFCEQRGSRHADPEIRKLANKVFDVLVVESPNLFGDYSKAPLPDGTFELTTPHRKV